MLVIALMVLSGCSSIRLGYNNAPQLSWWWLDGHVDFSREQAPPVRQGIDDFYAWHRATQLPAYVELLDEMQRVVLNPTSAEQICRWQDRFGPVLKPSIDRALLLVAERLPRLTDAQLAHISKRYDKGNAEARSDFLQPDPKRRLDAAIERTVERAERLYGSLDPAQLTLVRDGVAASPFEPERWLQARRQRQDQTLAALRRLQTEGVGPEQRLVLLRGLVDGFEWFQNRSDDRSYQAQLRSYNCALAARVHNATSAAQRLHARDTLKGWEDDLRALVSAPS